MTIYLCVKTHTITGLKYLCKTKSKDPHKYLGSGTYWKAHLKVHGKEHTTEILKECSSNEEIKQWGLHYSELWDIVNVRDKNNKKLWANLVSESGDGGSTSAQITAKQLATKLKNGTLNNSSPKAIAKCLQTKLEQGTHPNSPDVQRKRLETRQRNGTNRQTAESIAQQLKTRQDSGTLNPHRVQLTCKYCSKNIGRILFGRWHGEKCKFKHQPLP